MGRLCYCWNVLVSCGSREKERTLHMPAWSRASQLSSVRYAYLATFEYTEGSQPLPKILDIEVQVSDKNPFGNVSAASIKLLTRITREIVRRDTYKTNCSVFGHIEGER